MVHELHDHNHHHHNHSPIIIKLDSDRAQHSDDELAIILCCTNCKNKVKFFTITFHTKIAQRPFSIYVYIDCVCIRRLHTRTQTIYVYVDYIHVRRLHTRTQTTYAYIDYICVHRLYTRTRNHIEASVKVKFLINKKSKQHFSPLNQHVFNSYDIFALPQIR